MGDIVVGLCVLTTILLGWWLVKGTWALAVATFTMMMQLGEWVGPILGVVFCLWLVGRIVNALSGK